MKAYPLYVLLAAAVLLPAAVFGTLTWRSYEEALSEAQTDVRGTVRLLREHAQRTFEAHELIFDLVDAKIAGMSWNDIASSRELHESLRTLVDRHDHLYGLWLIDPQGICRNASLLFPISIAATDRDYYKAQKARDQLFFGGVLIGRVQGNLSFNLSRRRGSPTDTFDGMILATVDLEYLENFWKGVSSDTLHAVHLIRSDGEVLARFPRLEGIPPPLPADSPLRKAFETSDSGVIDRTGTDGVKRIYAYAKVGRYPVFVGFGLDRASVLAPWQANVTRNAVLTAVVAGLLCIMVLIAMRESRRQVEANLELRGEISRREKAEITVAEKEQLLEELHRAAEERQAILENMVEGLAVLDSARNFVYMNAAGRKLLDVPPDAGQDGTTQLLGMHELKGPDGQVLSANERPHARVMRGEILRGMEVDIALPRRVATCRFQGAPLRDRTGRIVGAVLTFEDITERRNARDRQQLLVAELNHRVRNVLAIIQAMVSLSAKSGETAEELPRLLSGRVAALARSHNRLTEDGWRGASLKQMVEEEIAPYGGETRLIFRAANDVVIRPREAQSLALVLHELATNAAKYGALSTDTGRITVEWKIVESGDGKLLRFQWRESGGPPVTEPLRRGFGSTLIERAFPQEAAAKTELSYEAGGFACRIEMPYAAIAQAEGDAISENGDEQDAAVEFGPELLSGRNVLVVEDEILVGLDIQGVLTDAGARVVGPIAELSRALALSESVPLDAALIDLNLSGEISTPVIERLTGRGVPVIVLSGYDDSSKLPESCRTLPRLRKPTASDRILAAVKNAISG